MQTILSRHWHHLPEEEVLDLLESDRDAGLDFLEVEGRQGRFGPNEIAEKEGPSSLERFLLQLRQPLLLILLVAAVITAVLGEWIDALVILGVVLVTATIGFIQETKAHSAIAALARYMGTEATVVRAGERSRIPASQLVPGDVVLLQSGDKVPADMRLLGARDLYVDESSLTGESVPVDKAAMVLDHDAVLTDRRNMTYMSTLVTYGRGTGIVVAIGDNTEIGRISELISSTEKLATPLTRRIAQFSHVLLYAILGLAALTFLVGVLRGEELVDMFMAAVALAVGAIPEGLPAAVTITLAIGVGRMAKRHSIIRSLPAVETLGSTTIICSDKTGTLTQNQMTVREAFAGEGCRHALGAWLGPGGRGHAGRLGHRCALGRRADGVPHGGRARQRVGPCTDGRGLARGGRPDGGRADRRSSKGRARCPDGGRGAAAHRHHPLRVAAPVHGDAARDVRRPTGGRLHQGVSRGHIPALLPHARSRR